MTGFSLMHHKSSHTRTSSDPTLINPVLLRLEEELHSLRSSSSSSSCTNSHVISCALTKVCCLYMSINELFCLTKNQQAINHGRNGKWVEEQLEDSVGFLDLIGGLRECMGLMREHVQGIRVSVRRKDESACAASEKMLMKQVKCCSKMLRHYGDGDRKSGVFGSDWDLVMADKMLDESREIVNGLFKSMMGFLLMPSLKMKAGKVGRWGGVFSKDWKLELCELKDLDEGAEELEKSLEGLFKRVVQNRVSLLNILSL